MINFEFKEITNNEQFDPVAICPTASFTQANFYGDWQVSLGREVKRFKAISNNKVVAYFQIIKYPLLSNKYYFYIPYGPVVENVSEELLQSIKNYLSDFARKNNAVFIRLDFTSPNKINNEALVKYFYKSPLYTYHSAYFQPRVEWFLKLNKTEDELLAGMHKNTRYSIRSAIKGGVETEIVTNNFDNYFNIFHELMLETAKRNGFSLHKKEYYQKIFENLHSKNAYLSIAKYQDKILTVNLVIVYGEVANHVFGGSSDEHRNLMPSYLAQWAGIKYAKQIGCSDYNFGGISSGELYKNWSGLTLFKTRFGGYEVTHSNFFDLVSQPFWYHLYNVRKFIKSYL